MAAGGHGTVGRGEAGTAAGTEVMDEVLDPGVVGVVWQWRAENPTHVLTQPVLPQSDMLKGGLTRIESSRRWLWELSPWCNRTLASRLRMTDGLSRRS